MYTLVVLSLIAAVLLFSGRREGLAPNDKIKVPSPSGYDTAEVDRIYDMIPPPKRDPYLQERQRAGRNLQQAKNDLKDLLRPFVATFYTSKYVPATTPIVLSDVTSWMSLNHGTFTDATANALQGALEAYFINQVAGTATTSGTTTTGGTTTRRLINSRPNSKQSRKTMLLSSPRCLSRHMNRQRTISIASGISTARSSAFSSR